MWVSLLTAPPVDCAGTAELLACIRKFAVVARPSFRCLAMVITCICKFPRDSAAERAGDVLVHSGAVCLPSSSERQ